MRARVGFEPEFGRSSCSIGVAKVFVGRAAETEAHVHEALRLSPRDEGAHRWMSWVGLAKLQLGADAEAVVWLRRSLKTNPNYPIAHFELAAALAHLGKMDEARAAVKEGLALDPTFTIRRLKSAHSKRRSDVSRARQAGYSGDAHCGSAGGDVEGGSKAQADEHIPFRFAAAKRRRRASMISIG